MTNIKFSDGADEFRISLTGRFAGPSVQDVRRTWTEKLAECLSRRITVDISSLSGYDTSGRKLLRDMYRHGIRFAAGTPASLVLLNEIAGPNRAEVVTLPEQRTDQATPRPPSSQRSGTQFVGPVRTMAAGKQRSG
jgi:hypothetical protein